MKSKVLVADHNQEDFCVMLAVLGSGVRRCEPWPPIRMKRLTRVGCNQEDVEHDTCLSLKLSKLYESDDDMKNRALRAH
jgi:hypothetical protein